MDSSEFRDRGKEMVDYIADYMDTLSLRRVTPEVEPGYLRDLLPSRAPRKGESFTAIMKDIERAIMPGRTSSEMEARVDEIIQRKRPSVATATSTTSSPTFSVNASPSAIKPATEHATVVEDGASPRDLQLVLKDGITHWQHPNFHAYFPAGNSYPSILGDMLSAAIGCIGFSWAASPACTELEIITLDWVGKMIGLPSVFLHESGIGGGVIQVCDINGLKVGSWAWHHSAYTRKGSASECILVALLAARHTAMRQLKNRFPFIEDGLLLSKLVAYSSKLAHSCVEKAGMIGFVKMRQLDVDDKYSLRGQVLDNAIEEDRRLGLIPFFVCGTLGTTACCSFDNIQEIGEVCAKENVWLHVDAAYAGNAMICPEFQHLLKGIENANSLNFNTNKWLQVNFDCSLMWVKDNEALTTALTVDPLYLQHKHGDKAIDFRHWGIPLSRRFRAIKLWFVIRTYGLEGLQHRIREHVRLAKLFKKLVETDDRFEIMGEVTMGLVCFRLQGPNAVTQKLLKVVNDSGKLHMVPALINEHYVIRFAICAEKADDKDIYFAWDVIRSFASEILVYQRDSNRDTEKGSSESISDEDDEVFPEFDSELIFDNQRCNMQRARLRRSLFLKMVSDPKSYNPRVLKALHIDNRRHRSQSLGGGSSKYHQTGDYYFGTPV